MEAFKSVGGTQWHFLDSETRESWCGIPPGSISLEEARPWDDLEPQIQCQRCRVNDPRPLPLVRYFRGKPLPEQGAVRGTAGL